MPNTLQRRIEVAQCDVRGHSWAPMTVVVDRLGGSDAVEICQCCGAVPDPLDRHQTVAARRRRPR